MPSYGQSVTLQYVAWDTANNVGKTGDVANHTLRWVKDGTSSAPANSAAEIDATNAPGIYKIVLTATEAQCQSGTLCGKSSTSGVVVVPMTYTFENLPTASPAASGGLPTCDGSNGVKISVGTGTGQVNLSSGKVPATLASTDVTGNVAADLQTIKTQTVTCSAGVTLAQFIGNATAALSVDASGRIILQPTQTGVTIPTVTTVTSVTNGVTVSTNNDKTGYTASTVSDKTGYSLAASGLDSITATDPGGVASTFPQMLVQLWRRFFKGSAKSAGAGTIVTYADNGSTVRTTQTYTDDGNGNETLGAAG